MRRRIDWFSSPSLIICHICVSRSRSYIWWTLWRVQTKFIFEDTPPPFVFDASPLHILFYLNVTCGEWFFFFSSKRNSFGKVEKGKKVDRRISKLPFREALKRSAARSPRNCFPLSSKNGGKVLEDGVPQGAGSRREKLPLLGALERDADASSMKTFLKEAFVLQTQPKHPLALYRLPDGARLMNVAH